MQKLVRSADEAEHADAGDDELIIGERLGEVDVRARYLLGSQFARDLRTLPGRDYQPVHGSYGVRSYLYS